MNTGVLRPWTCAGTHGPRVLQERIEAFLESSTALLTEMQPEDFEKHLQALIAAKMQQDHNLLEESERHWEQIQSRRYAHDRPQHQETNDVTVAKRVSFLSSSRWSCMHAASHSTCKCTSSCGGHVNHAKPLPPLLRGDLLQV